MERMSDARLSKCAVCGDAASAFTGHVHYEQAYEKPIEEYRVEAKHLRDRCAELEAELAVERDVIHSQALLDNEAHDAIGRFSGAIVNPVDQTIESVNGHYIYIKAERLEKMKGVCEDFGKALAKILSVWKKQNAELERETASLKDENARLKDENAKLRRAPPDENA